MKTHRFTVEMDFAEGSGADAYDVGKLLGQFDGCRDVRVKEVREGFALLTLFEGFEGITDANILSAIKQAEGAKVVGVKTWLKPQPTGSDKTQMVYCLTLRKTVDG